MPAGLKDLRGLSIRVFDSRGWSTTLLEAFLDTQAAPYVISDQYKNSFESVVDAQYVDGRSCADPAKVRISGDLADHLRFDGSSVVASQSGNLGKKMVQRP